MYQEKNSKIDNSEGISSLELNGQHWSKTLGRTTVVYLYSSYIDINTNSIASSLKCIVVNNKLFLIIEGDRPTFSHPGSQLLLKYIIEIDYRFLVTDDIYKNTSTPTDLLCLDQTI